MFLHLLSSVCICWLKACLGLRELNHLSPPLPKNLPESVKKYTSTSSTELTGPGATDRPFPAPCSYHSPLCSSYRSLPHLCPLSSALFWLLYSSHLLPAPLLFPPLIPRLFSFNVSTGQFTWGVQALTLTLNQPHLLLHRPWPPSAVKVRAQITGRRYHPLKWGTIRSSEIVK